jgi:hypothetical protein
MTDPSAETRTPRRNRNVVLVLAALAVLLVAAALVGPRLLRPTVRTPLGSLALTGASLDESHPRNCTHVGCMVTSEGYLFLYVELTPRGGLEADSLQAAFPDSVRATAGGPDTSGVVVRSFQRPPPVFELVFAVRADAEEYVLLWPGNPPVSVRPTRPQPH